MWCHKYVESPAFDPLFAYAFDDNQKIDLANGEQLPEGRCRLNYTSYKTAFNAQFEQVCINKYFSINSSTGTVLRSWRPGWVSPVILPASVLRVGIDQDKQKAVHREKPDQAVLSADEKRPR